MPINYHIDSDEKLVEVTVTDVLSYMEALRFQRNVATDPGFVPALNLLVELNRMTAMMMSGDDMRSLIHATPFASDRQAGDRVRRAPRHVRHRENDEIHSDNRS